MSLVFLTILAASLKIWLQFYIILSNLLLQDDKVNENDVTDYKTSQKFAQHMSDKVEASSDFAKRKSIAQQRSYLPVFAVRQDVSITTNLAPLGALKF